MWKLLKINYVLLILAQHKVHAKDSTVLMDVGRTIFTSLENLSVYIEFFNEALIVYELFQSFTNVMDQDNISAKLSDVSSQIDELSQIMLSFERQILKKIDTLEMTNKLRDIYVHIDRINFLYEYGYLNFINTSKVYFHETKENFAKKILSFDHDAVNYSLEEIHNLVLETDTSDKNILMYYSSNDDFSKSFMCQKRLSPQRLILDTFELIVLTEIKGLILITYAYKILQNKYKSKNKTSELDDAKFHQKKRMERAFNAIKKAAEGASREIWPCDPEYHVLGETYNKLGPLFQKYVMFEGDAYPEDQTEPINRDKRFTDYFLTSYFKGSVELSRICQNDCPYYKYVDKPYCHSDVCKKTPSNRVCIGHIHDCEYFESNLYICFGEKKDDRRYQSIRTGDGRVFGDGDKCPQKEFIALSGYAVGTFYNCDYCLCTCEDNSKENLNQFINLIPVISDIEENKIIIGVQIVNVNNIFHIKIQQGELLPKGRINRQSITWKDVLDYDVSDETFESGKDYHEITWNHRTFHLDDVEGYVGDVLTGLRFMLDSDKNVKLAIQTMPFNFTTGQLAINDSVWIDNPNSDISTTREELKLGKSEIPTQYTKHEPDSQSNQYVKLTTSDMDQDAGQTVVPFFDTQQVISSNPMPLSGAGLIHKGYQDSAGFLALKIFTFDTNLLLQDII